MFRRTDLVFAVFTIHILVAKIHRVFHGFFSLLPRDLMSRQMLLIRIVPVKLHVTHSSAAAVARHRTLDPA